MNYFAYERISSQEERNKQKYARQEKALTKYAESNNIEYTLVFKEDISGKNFEDRKQWQKLESLLKPGDTIVFKDITRFTREAEHGYEKYMELLKNDINLVFLDNTTISTSYIRELLHVAEQQDLVAKVSLEGTVKVLLIVELDRAEKERTILIKRTKDGLAASNKKSGRKIGKIDKLTSDLKDDIQLYLKDRSISQVSLMKKYDISRNTLKKYANLVKEGKISDDMIK